MLEHAMKILERVFERIIQGAITISDIQMGFMPGKSTVYVIFAVKQLVEKYCAVEKDLFVAFIDLEKAFDLVLKEIIWWALRKKGVIKPEGRAVMEMYRQPERPCNLRAKRLHGLKLKLVRIKVLC